MFQPRTDLLDCQEALEIAKSMAVCYIDDEEQSDDEHAQGQDGVHHCEAKEEGHEVTETTLGENNTEKILVEDGVKNAGRNRPGGSKRIGLQGPPDEQPGAPNTRQLEQSGRYGASGTEPR